MSGRQKRKKSRGPATTSVSERKQADVAEGREKR